MITRITKDNANKYRALFADAVLALQTHDMEGKPITEGGTPVIEIKKVYEPVELTAETFEDGFHYIKEGELWVLTSVGDTFQADAEYAILKEEGEEITTLEEYFGHITTLRAINNKFVMLPMDDEENYFYINANTRVITVPQSFAKNGISVQGDVISEILYFKIDRFYDMDDLATKQVYIEWRTSEQGSDGKQIEGVSVPFIVDANVAPGYVIVGWPISPELTKKAGKIEFAVRFYTMDETDGNNPELLYSFSTLSASADIKPTLNLDLKKISLEDSELNYNNLIINRLVDTESSDSNTPEPEAPEFIEDENFFIHPSSNDYTVIEPYAQENDNFNSYKVYLTNPITGEELDGKFIVQTKKPNDTSRLSYIWIKREENNEVDVDYSEKYEGQLNANVFEEVVDYSITNKDKIYYQEIEGQANDYKEIIFTEDKPDLASYKLLDENFKAYERKAIAIITADKEKEPIGSYQVRAVNRLGRKTAKTLSDRLYVMGPTEPEITKDIADEDTHLRFNEEGKIVLEVEANTDPHAYNIYTLYRRLKDEDVKVGDSNTIGIFEVTGAKYDPEHTEIDMGDGNYYVSVESLLNTVKLMDMGEVYRITHPASPVSIVNKEPISESGKYDINEELSIAVEIHPSEMGKRTDEDVLTYQWYKYNAPNATQFEIDIKNAKEGKYQVRPVLDEKIEGATQEKVSLPNSDDNDNGYYFCCVTNVYNGSSVMTCSDFFDVVDTSKESE